MRGITLKLFSSELNANQYRINFQKREFHSKNYEHVLLLVFRNCKEHKLIKKKISDVVTCSLKQ